MTADLEATADAWATANLAMFGPPVERKWDHAREEAMAAAAEQYDDDLWMDEGEIQAAENRYEAWLDRIGVA